MKLLIQSARVESGGAGPVAFLTINGQEFAFMIQKATFLRMGFAVLPDELSQYGETFEIYPDNETDSLEIPQASQDPVLVELMRRLWVGELKPGPVDVPSEAEAQAARWRIDPQQGVFERRK